MNSNLQAIIRTAHISMVRAMDGDQAALAATQFNLSLALEIANLKGVEHNARLFALLASSDIDEGRFGAALTRLEYADHDLEWLEQRQPRQHQ